MAIQEQISKLEAGSASYAEKTTVVGQPDVPGLSTREMQESVEYMPRNLLLPKLNEVVGAVNQCYTKAEADKAIAGKVTEIGAGDMAQAGAQCGLSRQGAGRQRERRTVCRYQGWHIR